MDGPISGGPRQRRSSMDAHHGDPDIGRAGGHGRHVLHHRGAQTLPPERG